MTMKITDGHNAFSIDAGPLTLSALSEFVYLRQQFSRITISHETMERVRKSFHLFLGLFEKRIPIYGVTTGFGDSCFRYITPEKSKQLQNNLVQYLMCGTGETLPLEVSRAILAIRLQSLSRGFSGVSPDLIERMRLYLEKDILPVIPKEGSLGASGDLVPLAYLASALQGQGEVFFEGQLRPACEVLSEMDLGPYELKPKEGLSLVNGTTAMAGFCLHNLKLADFLVELSELTTAWTVMAIKGRREAFSSFINSVAKTNPGQSKSAENIRNLLQAENYQPVRGQDVGILESETVELVQDRYSVRCVPQILGPIRENLGQGWNHLLHEINSITDNPLITESGDLEMGGNFYGGYLCQSMDFAKINIAHLADLVDRQVMLLVDEKSNRGLPPNLINRPGIPEEDWGLHHGLKGVHQAVSAITSEIMARATPNGIFSRSSESHNQDKVSLGMSAASQCLEMLKPAYTIFAMQLICAAQALDLRKIELRGRQSKQLYSLVRSCVAFIEGDQSLAEGINKLSSALREIALNRREFSCEKI